MAHFVNLQDPFVNEEDEYDSRAGLSEDYSLIPYRSCSQEQGSVGAGEPDAEGASAGEDEEDVWAAEDEENVGAE